MALKEQALSHPYLFFTRDDLPELRARCQPHAQCRRLILDTAARIVDQPLPDEPAPGPPTTRDEDGFLSAYLEVHYQFYTAAYALHYHAQVLAFAYVLSDDDAYARRARDWALHFAGWQLWGPRAAPHGVQAAHCLLGTTLVYDWLGDFLTGNERNLLQGLMRDHVLAFRQCWPETPEGQIAESTSHLDTSSTWVCLAAAGVASLALLYEDAEAAVWAEDGARFFAEQVLPASFGGDGSFREGAGWWDIYALRQGVLFFDALVRCGGPNLFENKNLQSYANFLLQSGHAWDLERPPQPRCWAHFQPPSPFHYRYVLLRLATAYGADDLFHAASCRGLDVPPHTPLDWFYRQLHRVPYEPGRWYTVTLSWDRSQGACAVGIDNRTWSIAIDALETVDGIHFGARGDGDGFCLRHLGLRTGDQAAVALLESDAALHLGGSASASVIPHLHMPELRLGFAAAPRGTVWFQLRKADVLDRVDIRLCHGREVGPGLELAPVDLFPAVGADFLQCDAQGETAPLGGYSGGEVWFDGPWEYLWYEKRRDARPPLPPRSHLFPDIGLAYLRSAAAELRLRAGPAQNKGRGDQNGFVVRLGDETLAGDVPQASSGEVALSQRQYDLDDFFLDSFACNTLLVNGRGQEPGPAPPWNDSRRQIHSGRIERFFATPHFDLVEGEAGNAYAALSGFRRQIAYIKPDYFVLADAVEATEPVEVEWLFHTVQELEVEGNRACAQGRRHRLELAVLTPEGAVLQRQWTPAVLQRERTPYARLGLRGERLQILAVLLPQGKSPRPGLKLQRVEGRGAYGVHCVRGGVGDLILFRSAGQEGLSLEGVRSDAAAVFLRRSGKSPPSLYALVGGTFLNVRSELVRADHPLDLLVHRTVQRLNARVQSAAATQLRLAIGAPPRTVRLDGEVLAPDRYTYTPQSRRLALHLEAGECEIDLSLK